MAGFVFLGVARERSQSAEHFGHRPAAGRNTQVWRNLGEGFEHKGPLRHAGMGDRQRGTIQDKVAVDQDIKVERARPPPLLGCTIASVSGLDQVKVVQEGLGCQAGYEERRGVEEETLRDGTDRLSFMKRGRGNDCREGKGGDFLEREHDVCAAVAKVGAQGDSNGVGMEKRDAHSLQSGSRKR